jgi:hypothetical protein
VKVAKIVERLELSKAGVAGATAAARTPRGLQASAAADVRAAHRSAPSNDGDSTAKRSPRSEVMRKAEESSRHHCDHYQEDTTEPVVVLVRCGSSSYPYL